MLVHGHVMGVGASNRSAACLKAWAEQLPLILRAISAQRRPTMLFQPASLTWWAPASFTWVCLPCTGTLICSPHTACTWCHAPAAY